jgi:hypothetical protein
VRTGVIEGKERAGMIEGEMFWKAEGKTLRGRHIARKTWRGETLGKIIYKDKERMRSRKTKEERTVKEITGRVTKRERQWKTQGERRRESEKEETGGWGEEIDGWRETEG